MKTTVFITLTLAAFASHTSARPRPLNEAEVARLQARQGPVTDVEVGVGLYYAIAAGETASVVAPDIANALSAIYGGDKAPYNDHSHCTINFHTKGGSNCYVKTFPASSSGNSSSDANTHDNDWNVCSWINPASTAPPIQYFNDPGVGDYSIQFTATDQVAWADSVVTGIKKCVAQGLCNPRLTFFRNGYNIILDTWKAFGESGDGEINGLCQGGDDEVQNQFASHGDLLGDLCAIPCWNDVNLPPHGGD